MGGGILMAVLSKLLVALGLDATDYQKGLEGIGSTTKSKLTALGGTFSTMGSQAKKLGTGLTAGVTLPIVAMGVKAVDMASDLDESMSKATVVFGDATEAVIAFSDGSAEALGLSQQEALEAAGTYGNLFVSMGLGQDVAADMSTGLVTLASDLASFNNAIPAEALDALRAGLTGETEPLKRFGVNMTAAGVAAKALELGLADVVVDGEKVHGLTLDLADAQGKAADALKEHGASSAEYAQAAHKVAEIKTKLVEASKGEVQELTSAQKAQAIYALVMEQTATAQGDFARTSDGLANSTRIAKAQLADAAATMGGQLLPIGLKVVQFVSDLIDKFTNLSPETQKTILVVAGLAAAIGPLLLGVGSLMSAIGAILPIIGAAAGAMGALNLSMLPIILVIGLIVAAIALLYLAWTNNWFGIRDTLTEVWETYLKPALETLIAWFQETIPVALQFLADVWNNVLLPAITAIWDFLNTYILPIFSALANVAIAVLKAELEILASIWENVLKPALEVIWSFIQGSIIPIFDKVATVIRDTLGPAFQWLEDHVLGPVASAFEAVKGAISGIVSLLNRVADAISSMDWSKLPKWLIPGSPTPLELGVRGINSAVSELARVQLPRLERAMAGLGNYSAIMGTGPGGGPTGDNYQIYNQSAGTAAVSWAIIEDRRRRRLNASMGGL